MDNLSRQTRQRFSGTEQEKKEEPGSVKDRRIPPQKIQSFKDKKKEPNWLRKQVTRQMSQDNDSNNEDERAMAVAAAVYAITENVKEELGMSRVPINSKKEDPTILIPRHGSLSKKFSEEIIQSSDNPDKLTNKKPEKTKGILKPDSSISAIKPEGSFNPGSSTSTSKHDVPMAAKPVSQPAETRRQSSSRAGAGKLQADIWEESELAKITERYNARKSTILSWKGKKTTKAKRRLEKAETMLKSMMVEAFEKYQRDRQNIHQIVSAAKAKAEEKKKNDELKAKEKANTFRKTGKVPSTCSCF